MQFRAATADINPSIEGWMFLRDVQCPVCFAVYHLWSLFSDTDQSEINLHIDWLDQYLMNICPNHAADIRTPEPSEEKRQTYWLEEARAHAIHEAEDAGLQGIEREAFIRERTDTYFAGLIIKEDWLIKPRRSSARIAMSTNERIDQAFRINLIEHANMTIRDGNVCR